ncbi:MAG: MBL fold hydrolase [Elusimicrobia bacterium GWC2_51_8]|nr:MAG: MBL fold hydrolase [Elusimicrobia bacterium GWA2_51_34]OGR61763.1 MAG: MBL fold hydrolase [Elusimicrobia bacterium GWC2_51_8]OGR87071.1 MAG: MBL fold hydrolase [Elusimicrobia bacterium GWF2_52_66]HAF96049.1 MBL fold hydrolase [Elusimicrobiota bacterium]HCE98657.1 MBL fold hydrolase [Elusimicrobiota bacterium]
MRPVKITENVYSLRVNHFNRHLFDSLIPLPDGTSYNAYLVKGTEKTALLDSVDPEKKEVLFDYLKGVEKLDYIVAHHAEQDHSGSISFVLEKYPSAKVVTNPRCKEFLMSHLALPADKFIEVKDGEILSLGGKTLEFVYLPWVHWPETMGTYLREDKILFSCDFFGSHLAAGGLFSDERTVYAPMKRYYAEIMMPFRSNIKAHLEKLSKYEINVIAPSHGPVHKNVKFVQSIYSDWAVGEPKNKALVAYVSMHGSTYILVNRLVSALEEAGVNVEKLNLEQFDEGRVAMALVDAATVIVGTPTVLAGPHPKAVYGACLMNALRPKVKFISIIGSYGWGGKAVETLAGMLTNIKAEIIPPVLVKGLPKEEDLKKIDELASIIALRHKGLEL